MIKKSINIILVFFILQTSIFSSVLPSEYKTERIGFIESTTNKIIAIDGLGGDGQGGLLPVKNLTSIFPSGISYTNAPKATDIPARYASTPEYIKTVVSQNFALTNTIKDSELKFREKYRIYKPAVSGLNIMPIFIPDPEPPYIPPWVTGDDPVLPAFNPNYKTFTSNKLYYPNETVNLTILNSVKTGDNTYEAETFHTEPGATLYPVLIGHSQGGLLAYEYARQYSMSDGSSVSPVSAVISYSSPLKGSKLLSREFDTDISAYLSSLILPTKDIMNICTQYGNYETLKIILKKSKEFLEKSDTEFRKLAGNDTVNLLNSKISENYDLVCKVSSAWCWENIPAKIRVALDSLKAYLSGDNSSIDAKYGIPHLIRNTILGTVFQGADASLQGIQDLVPENDYITKVLLPETALATGAMQPKNQKAKELVPTAYGAIIGTQTGKETLKSLVQSHLGADPDKVSAELSAFESAFNDGFLYNLGSLLYSQDAVIESEWDCDDEGHKWIVSTYVTCIKLDTGKMSLLDFLYDMAQQLHYHNPVQKSYELFEKYKCEGLVSQEDQAIDSLNQAGESENYDIYG